MWAMSAAMPSLFAREAGESQKKEIGHMAQRLPKARLSALGSQLWRINVQDLISHLS